MCKRRTTFWKTLNYDLDVSFPLQLELLWNSSSSRLNRKFANDGTKVAKHRETVNMAIEITLTAPFEGLRTPRTFLLRAVSVLLCNSPDEDWIHEEDLKGWGLGEFPHLLHYDNVSHDDLTHV